MKTINKNKIGYLIVLYIFLYLITSAYGVPVNPGTNKLPPTYELGPKIWLVNPDSIMMDKALLASINIDINDINALKEATTPKELSIRLGAYHLLALQHGSRAIPILQGCLDNTDYSKFFDHLDIARFLALLGDQSGLKKLRDEIIILTKYEEEIKSQKADSDPNKKTPPPLGIKTSKRRLAYCLESAGVLAEFGDSFRYDMAVKEALDKSSASALKFRATNVLTNLSRLDKEEQKARGIDPEAVLLSMVDIIESEEDIKYLNVLIFAEVLNNMKPESQVKYFEKCQQLPYLSDADRQKYQSVVKRLTKLIERQKQAKENQQKDPNSAKK